MDARPRARRARISRSGDFDAAYRRGRSAGGRHLVVHTFPRAERDGEPPRLGLSVSRRVGGAVERNRVKRALRERFAEIVPLLPTGLDVVVVARPGCVRYLDEHGSAALGERLRDLALRSAAPGAEVPGA